MDEKCIQASHLWSSLCIHEPPSVSYTESRQGPHLTFQQQVGWGTRLHTQSQVGGAPVITSQSGALVPKIKKIFFFIFDDHISIWCPYALTAPPLAEVMIYCSNFLPGYHHHMYYLYVIIILITSSENQSYFYIFSPLDWNSKQQGA